MSFKKDSINNLRVNSIAKIDRIVAAKRSDVIAVLGKLSETDLEDFENKFIKLIDS